LKFLGFLVLACSVHAAVLTQNWRESKLTMTLDDGAAEIEMITQVSFRAVRVWGTQEIPVSGIAHNLVLAARETTPDSILIKTRYLTIEVNKATGAISLRTPDSDLGKLAFDRSMPAKWKPGEAYGVFPRTSSSNQTDFVVCVGPTPKEIFEQYATVRGSKQVTPTSLTGSVRDLIRASWDMTLDARLQDGAVSSLWTRPELEPYRVTYRRESLDRGFPTVRPLGFQFPKDQGTLNREDAFMFGDEFLIVPGSGKLKVEFPRGRWTDLRTNTEYAGRQAVEFESPDGRVAMFARNGAVFPWQLADRMELHYMPSLGGEFFLWEEPLQ